MQRSETIQADGAASATVNIGMATGDLRISGGAADLMQGDFVYDEELEPRIDYRLVGSEGTLDIQQEPGNNVRATRNEWDIRLNDSLPINLHTTVASAGATLNLDSLQLELLDLHSASGEATVSLAGEQPDLGHINMETASGRIALQLDGTYRDLKNMRIRTASGQIDVTLGSDWQEDLDARIESVSGEVIVRVPLDIGVIIGVSTISGRVNTDAAPGFQSKGRTYSNEALETSKIKLQLRVSTVSGGITIVEVD